MLFATRFRLVFLCLLPLLAGFMASSCQSSRPSFSFQPAPYRAATAVAPRVSTTLADSAALPAAPVAEAVVVGAAPTPHPGAQRLVTVLPRLQTAALTDPTLATTTTLPQAQLRHWPRLLRQQATHGAAENGLGRVALFFIGVALAIVAGLAALFALIPGVSFWGGVGLAVGALVVLYLLYSLVSGGKKK
ncbi:hypothetical protein E4631_07960 [Hymenobacter sp. UV11]|uniref:hypothetical protein n=1 Tax=Hymenobacter sp. UV11 TaxID=1849735 RepID=UPI00105BFCED|nr:hypothetical protein [Hymenobacter sp. UV11]TDN36189.1 hypothetical protein A8B98_09670 [Hymenobacter sp. UV11]TFZ66891.1 hypothetical protein E4631_07960 [Hymenobacter sp. UV11]